MKKLEHLLILTPGFPNDEQETECLPAVQQFIHCYRKLFPAVHLSVLSLHYPFNKSNYQWHGLDVLSICGKNQTGLKRFPIIWKAMRAGLKINRKAKVDAVLSLWLTDAAFAGKLITKRLNIPHLVWMHGQEVKPGNKYIRLLKPTGGQLAAISTFQNDVFYKNYGMKAEHIISNGINEDVFPGFNDGIRTIDVLAVGSLVPLKQFHLFVEVVKYLKENVDEQINAVLIGDGVMDEDIEQLIDKWGLMDNIRMVHKAKHDQVLNAMNDAKVFVHPSSYEGHSTVMLEALYSGCKVVSFIPVGNHDTDKHFLCSDMEEMKTTCAGLLKQQLVHERIKYADMNDSASHLNDILYSMINDATYSR